MKKDDRLIYLLFMAQQRIRTYLKKALHREGVRVTYAQAGILFLLKQRDGQSMSALSRVLGADNSTITGLVDRMEKFGFVTRKAGASDRRMFRIHITPQGLEQGERAGLIINRVNEEFRSGLSLDEIEAFKRVLNGLFEKFPRD